MVKTEKQKRKTIWRVKSKHFPRLIKDVGDKKPYETQETFMDKQKTSHPNSEYKVPGRKRRNIKSSQNLYIYIYS